MVTTKFENEIWIWHCPCCNATGKKSTTYNKAFQLFTSHRYSQQSKYYWDCEFEVITNEE